MGALAEKNGAGKWSERLCQASAVRIHLIWLGFCQAAFPHLQFSCLGTHSFLIEQHSRAYDRKVCFVGTSTDFKISKGGGPMK